MKYNPIRLNGNWDEGYALDVHVVESIFLGNDEHGKPHFENIRSEVGEAVFQLKYRNNISLLNELAETACDFIKNKWGIKIYGIIASPPSRARFNQPVFMLTQKIGEFLNVPYSLDFFTKNSTIEVKNMSIEEKAKLNTSDLIKKNGYLQSPNSNILIIDDLYNSGFSMNLVVNLLKEDKNIGKIYILTMTKTKR